jgi:hypothetical protein
MNRTIFTLASIALSLGGGLRAENAPATVAQPMAPAPVVNAAAATKNDSPPAATAPNASAPTNATQIVYTPQLPNVADLTKAANEQGYTVEKVVQTNNQIIAFYRQANGQQTTVAYQTLPPSAASAPALVAAPAPVVVTAPPTVVYESAPRVVYYDDYYPRVWYPPISLSFGFGYRSFRGGYYGGHRWR